jgi:hypothetical protein
MGWRGIRGLKKFRREPARAKTSESLYRALSPSGHPTLKTLLAVLKTVGLGFRSNPKHAFTPEDFPSTARSAPGGVCLTQIATVGLPNRPCRDVPLPDLSKCSKVASLFDQFLGAQHQSHRSFNT